MKTSLLTFSLVVCSFWFVFLYWTAHPAKPSPPPAQIEEQAEPEVQYNPPAYDTEEMKRIIGRRDVFRRMK